MTNARSQSDTPGNLTRRTVYPHAPNFPPGLNIKPSDGSDSSLFVPSSRNDGNDGSDGETAAAAGLGEGLQVQQDVDTYGIGGKIWDAAYTISVYLRPEVHHPSLIFDPPCPLFPSPSTASCFPSRDPRPITILELGSGTGYVALHLAPYLSHRDRLILTDLADVRPLQEKNLEDARHIWRRRRDLMVTGKEGSPDLDVAQVFIRTLEWGSMGDVVGVRRGFGWDHDCAGAEGGAEGGIDYIIGSDLVYYPFLYPGLLRTLIGLTEPRRKVERGAVNTPKVLLAYKMRSLSLEEKFWNAFARYFDLDYVVSRPRAQPTAVETNPNLTGTVNDSRDDCEPDSDPDPPKWQRFGQEDGVFVFVATRKPSTYLPVLIDGSDGDGTGDGGPSMPAWLEEMTDEELLNGPAPQNWLRSPEGRGEATELDMGDAFERILLGSICLD